LNETFDSLEQMDPMSSSSQVALAEKYGATGPCLVHPKNQNLFKISRHIKYCGIYKTLNIDKNKN